MTTKGALTEREPSDTVEDYIARYGAMVPDDVAALRWAFLRAWAARCELLEALEAAKTRYSRDRGEPKPTPAFPVEVVFTMPQWYKVLAAIAKYGVKP